MTEQKMYERKFLQFHDGLPFDLCNVCGFFFFYIVSGIDRKKKQIL